MRTRKFAYLGAGALAAAAVVAIAVSQMSRSGSANLEAADKPAAVSTPTSSPVVAEAPALPATAGTSSGSAAITVIPPPPATKPPVRQEKSSAPTRDTRVAAKTQPKPVQSRVAAAPTTPSVVLPAPSLTTRQEPAASPPVVTSVPPAPQPKQEAPAPAPAAPSAADIAPTVQAYARAIESRDIGAIRRVYPGLTSDQQRGFEQFFQAARNINVTFRLANVETSGSSADARLVGAYEYVTTAGKAERQPVSFAATLRHDGNTWRLVSVR